MNPSMYGLTQEKWVHYLFVGYCIFILYGCLIPFHFNFDPNFVRWRWEVFLIEPLRVGVPRLSTSDILSNILLFVPFGALLIWPRSANPPRRRAVTSIVFTTCYGLAFGVVLESAQTLSPWRNPSPIDVVFNGTGAFIGATSGRVLFRAFGRELPTGFVRILRHKPSLLVLAYILLGVFVDSFYPFAITLDPSAIWQNVKQSQFLNLQSPFQRWFDVIIEKAGVFAAIGYLISINVQYPGAKITAFSAWLLCASLALILETAKLFFVGRAFFLHNVIISCLGGFVGTFLITRFPTSPSINTHPQMLWLACLGGCLLYFELAPFDWISLNEIAPRFSQIEWLPFRSYYSAEPLAALFDLQQKIYFLVPLGFVVMSLGSIQCAALPRRRALFVCIFIALGLESLQMIVRPRIPSTTDVIIFSASAWVGIALFEVFKRTNIQKAGQTTFESSGSEVKRAL
jgi:VanZ family protein